MDLIIEDEYVQQMGEYLCEEAQFIHKLLREYITILKNVCEDGITEGKTARALAEFVSQAEQIKGIDEIGNAAKRFCKNYINQIDSADGDLY